MFKTLTMLIAGVLILSFFDSMTGWVPLYKDLKYNGVTFKNLQHALQKYIL